MNARITRVLRTLLEATDQHNYDSLIAAVGITRSALYRKLRGETRWTVEDVKGLADYFKVPEQTFYSGVAALLTVQPKGLADSACNRFRLAAAA